MLCQSLWYGSIWCTLVTLSLLATMGARQVSPVILVCHTYVMIAQSFENSKKSAFFHTLVIDIGFKE